MNPRVDKWLDLLDRAGWTAIQAAAGAVVAYLAFDDIGWEEGLVFVGAATAAAVLKVIIGQNTGSDDTGALGVSPIQPAPEDRPDEVVAVSAKDDPLKANVRRK
jgi:hypothetical protein